MDEPEEMDDITRKRFWKAMKSLGKEMTEICKLAPGRTVHLVSDNDDNLKAKMEEYLSEGGIVYNVTTKKARWREDDAELEE